jgi:hypothetical protein
MTKENLMKKLSVKNGTTLGVIFMMAFINTASRYCPIDFLRTNNEIVEPNWITCIFGFICAVASLGLFRSFTKDEGTTLEDGSKVDLNGKKVKGDIIIEED